MDCHEALKQRITRFEEDFALIVAALRECLEPPATPPRDAHGRCSRCGGVGGFADGSYCTCALGRDLEKIHRKSTEEKTG